MDEQGKVPTEEELELFRFNLVRLMEDMGRIAGSQLLNGPTGQAISGILRATMATISEIDAVGMSPRLLVLVDWPAAAQSAAQVGRLTFILSDPDTLAWSSHIMEVAQGYVRTEMARQENDNGQVPN
jgi:hypothetical protein